MLSLSQSLLRTIETAARAAWPEECCGLLVGRAEGGRDIRVNRVAASPNLAQDPRTGFEIDPQLWLDLRRDLAGQPDRIVGLYHSHPDGSALPSDRDAAAAWAIEPAGTIWLIVALKDGAPAGSRAYLFQGEGSGFAEMPLTPLD